jgi:hypothetical protein
MEKETRIRNARGYSWFENYEIPVDVAREEGLGKYPSIQEVKKVYNGQKMKRLRDLQSGYEDEE